MRLLIALTTAACAACLAGCPANNTSEADTKIVQLTGAPELRDAIITQHSLFPYHFVKNSDTLNELGRSDLNVLTEHFKDNPGDLNIRRGDASADLYKARVARVLRELEKGGVQVARVKVADGLPGGDGMYSEQVLKVLNPPQEAGGAMGAAVVPAPGGASGGYGGSSNAFGEK